MSKNDIESRIKFLRAQHDTKAKVVKAPKVEKAAESDVDVKTK